MTICKQCVHYLVCMHYSPERKKCTQFKDSTNYVEVVRCKDCKHRYNGKDCTHPLLLSYSWGAIRNVKDDDFCSYGERKDNG